MNSGPGFPRTVLVGTKGCLVIGTCWGVWGQIPTLPGALCGCGCHGCVLLGVQRCSSKAGSACVNLRIATRRCLLGVCKQGPGPRHVGLFLSEVGGSLWPQQTAAAAGLSDQNWLLYLVLCLWRCVPGGTALNARRDVSMSVYVSYQPGYLRSQARTDGALCKVSGMRRETDISLSSAISPGFQELWC